MVTVTERVSDNKRDGDNGREERAREDNCELAKRESFGGESDGRVRISLCWSLFLFWAERATEGARRFKVGHESPPSDFED